jgi:hypothetical protein
LCPAVSVLQQGKEDTVPFESGLRVLHVLTIVSRSACNRMYLMADGTPLNGVGSSSAAPCALGRADYRLRGRFA